MKKRYIVLIVVSVILIIAGFMVRSFSRQAEEGLAQLSSMTLSTPDLRSVPDGVRMGTYEAFPVKVTVQVTVSDHRIVDIELTEHRNGQGKPAEALLPLIVEKQRVELDAISGATYSSLVILKAVEQALMM